MENVYINILIIIVSILIYHIFITIHQIFKKNSKYVLVILSALSIVLCMHFPIYEQHGHVYDLRFIPMFIGAIYGGRNVVLSLVIFSVVNRFFIGGDGFYVYLITITVVLFFLYYWYIPRFNSLLLKQKLIYSMFIAMFYPILEFLICHLWFGTLEHIPPRLIGVSLITNLFVTVGVIYLIEYLRKANELMENYYIQDKFKGLSEMASSISHEVRNPLTVTKGFIQLVMNDEKIEIEKRNLHLGLALQELNRAESIITDYLTYAKPYEEINLEQLDVIEEIKYTVNVLNPLALMNNVHIQVKHQQNEAYLIKNDKKKFHQIIINLSKNAIEAMPSGGDLVIKISKESKFVSIEISDTGVGMTEEELSRLGTPFFSMKEKGTGLGTMVVFSLVDTLNGRISVTSIKREGTTFQLLFKSVDHIAVSE
ncbi:ATP-binding protein [Evansella sp. AB-rgal1]|uniref:ATP-binding protein n=1 Tax=Evansella sp. AB-rgal1 TaxID=3242696 RepID=UPI00359E91B9